MTEEEELPQRTPDEDPAAAIERLSGELDGVARVETGGAVEFRRGGIPFVVCEGTGYCFRLRAEIAQAGLRTPQTAPSARGDDWIWLDTSVRDEYTLDRTRAWFELAWRLAGEP